MTGSSESRTPGSRGKASGGRGRRNLVAPLLLVAGLLLGACSSSGDGSDASARASGEGTVPVTAEAAASAGGTTIEIAGFDFGDPVTVHPGDTVTVVNTDPSTHTWTAVGDEWDSGNLTRGDSFDFTFAAPGEYAFFCRIHPTMTGTVTVEG